MDDDEARELRGERLRVAAVRLVTTTPAGREVELNPKAEFLPVAVGSKWGETHRAGSPKAPYPPFDDRPDLTQSGSQ
jgi:hypothetical protein